MAKDTHILIRTTLDQRATIKQHAKDAGMTMSDFMMNSTLLTIMNKVDMKKAIDALKLEVATEIKSDLDEAKTPIRNDAEGKKTIKAAARRVVSRLKGEWSAP